MTLTSQHLARYVEECRAKGHRPATINHDLRAFKAALNWAADPDRGALLPRLPLRIKLVSERKINGASVRRQIITPEQFQELLDAAGTPKVRAVLALCGLAGLRQGEALHLKVGDVDLERRLVSVREKPEENWSPKTYQERDIEMGPRLHGELSRYLETLSPETRQPDCWLFTSRRCPGERLRYVRPQVSRAFQRAGINVPRAGCHTMRKTWATAAGELGDYEALREMGGWSSWQAMAHYVAAGQEQRRRIAERF
jgi:integrase